MKAKYFKELRAERKLYYIMRSPYMFGDFNGRGYDYRIEVPLSEYAKVSGVSPQNAVLRFTRKNGTSADVNNRDGIPEQCSEMFAKWKVLPVLHPSIKNVTYWG